MNPKISINEIRDIIQACSHETTKEFIRKLMKQLKYINQQQSSFLKEIFSSISIILKDANQHPLTKLKSHQLIMYLILMGDPEVYDAFEEHLLPIFKGNCQYNRNMNYDVRGEDFFKKTKFFTDSSTGKAQKNQIKNCGIDYMIFSLETILNLAKWLPYEIQDETNPSKFAIVYQNMVKDRITFPAQTNFKFFSASNVDIIEQNIKQIQQEIYSTLYSDKNTSSFAELQIQSDNKKNSYGIGSLPWASNTPLKQEIESQSYNKAEQHKKKLQNQIQTQRKYFEQELLRQKSLHQENIYKYQRKINSLEDEMQMMKGKMTIVQNRPKIQASEEKSANSDHSKDKIIEDLQKLNQTLSAKVKNLQEALKSYSQSNNFSSSNSREISEISKLKKQNIALKTKLLTQCQQNSQFQNKKNKKNMKEPPESLQFLGFQDARSCFQPFYSNSSSQIKVRLRKAILREKQLLYKDKTLEIGCITKLESINTVKLTVVFTNISQQPLFNFFCEYVTRQDLTVKILSNCRNYLEISGQTKSQVFITVNQIDFRCLLSSIRFSIENSEQKIALIMPISKLKLSQQLVYTPRQSQGNLESINGKNPFLSSPSLRPNGNKIERVFKSDRKILPNLHKFKDYFKNSLIQKDITGHQTYIMKLQFMGSKFYIQIDQIGNETRIAIFYSDGKIAEAQKLLDEMLFIFAKN